MTMEWQRKNRERYLDYLHGWCERNRARTRMNSKIYYWKHREDILARIAEKRKATTFFRSLDLVSRIGSVELPTETSPEQEAAALAKQERRREYWRQRWAAIKADPKKHEQLNAQQRTYKQRQRLKQRKSNQQTPQGE